MIKDVRFARHFPISHKVAHTISLDKGEGAIIIITARFIFFCYFRRLVLQESEPLECSMSKEVKKVIAQRNNLHDKQMIRRTTGQSRRQPGRDSR